MLNLFQHLSKLDPDPNNSGQGDDKLEYPEMPYMVQIKQKTPQIIKLEGFVFMH